MAVDNPIKSLMGTVAKNTQTGDAQTSGDAQAINEKMKMVDNLARPTMPEKTTPAAPSRPAQSDLVNPGNKGKTGRQALDDMNKRYPDLPKMHTGGTVPKTGPYMMKEGEKVLTPEQHGKLKAAMGLASDALSHDPGPEKEPEMPKHLREMHIKELHTGGFHVTKHSGKPGDEATTHGAPDNDSVVGHFMDHMGHPDEDEEDVEAGDHDMDGGKMAIQKAIGLK